MNLENSRNLILSWHTYDWVLNCSGLVLEWGAEKFAIMIICCDDHIPIASYPLLCRDAVYVQRMRDIFYIGKELGIRKIMNLRYDEFNLDLERLITQLHLYIEIQNMHNIFFSGSIMVDIMRELVKRTKRVAYRYDRVTNPDYTHFLEEDIREKKVVLNNLIVGYPNTSDVKTSFVEKFELIN